MIIRRDTFIANVMKMFSGTVLAQLVWVISMPVLTRLYGPEEFGWYQLVITICSVLSMIVTGRYEMAIVVPKAKAEAARIFVLTIVVLFCTVILFGVVCLLLMMADVFSELDYVWEYILLYLFLVNLYTVVYAWMVREKRYSVISCAVVLFPIVNLITALLLFKMEWMDGALIKSACVGRLAGIFLLLYWVWRLDRRIRKVISWQKLCEVAYRYREYPYYMIIGGAVDSLTAAMPTFFLTQYYGVSVTGVYSVANQALSMPGALVAKAIGDVFRQKSSYILHHQNNCSQFFRKNLYVLLCIAMMVLFSIIFAAPVLFEVVFGETWGLAGEYAQAMAPMVATGMIASPLSLIYITARLPGKYFTIQCMYLLFGAITLFIAKFLTNDIWYILLLYSLSSTIVSIINVYGGYKIADGKYTKNYS